MQQKMRCLVSIVMQWHSSALMASTVAAPGSLVADSAKGSTLVGTPFSMAQLNAHNDTAVLRADVRAHTGASIASSPSSTDLDAHEQGTRSIAPNGSKERPRSNVTESEEHSMLELQEQLNTTEKELKIQSSLVHEKEEAVEPVSAKVTLLRTRAEKIRREADVATEIAKEKMEAATKAERDQHDAENRAKYLIEEKQETEKFLAQTQKEAEKLRKRLAEMQKQASQKRSTAVARAATTIRAATMQTQGAPASRARVEPKTGISVPSDTHSNTTSVPKVKIGGKDAALLSKAGVVTVSEEKQAILPGLVLPVFETVQQLMAENRRLAQEKAQLEGKLAAATKEDTAAHEKSILKRRLKNKLLKADRKQPHTH